MNEQLGPGALGKRKDADERSTMKRMMKLVAFALMVLSLLAAPAYACLATPAPEHAWDRGNTENMPYPKGEEGPMAPIMGGADDDQGGIPTASEKANDRFPNDDCTSTDMHYCSEGVDRGGVSR